MLVGQNAKSLNWLNVLIRTLLRSYNNKKDMKLLYGFPFGRYLKESMRKAD
jgi:hypothetical protein